MNDIPLIWTTHGNIPESDLRVDPVWEETADYTKLSLRHYLGDELVKESCFVLGRRALPIGGELGNFGG